MSDKEERKKSLQDLLNKNRQTPAHQPQPQKVVKKGKMGRPSDKNPEIHYVKLSVNVPFELREEIKIALLTTHKYLGHTTQDSFVAAAVENYLKTKKK